MYWIYRMGLLTWEYAFTHGKTETDSRAEVDRNFTAKIATVTLDNDFGEDNEVDHKIICKTAFHEAHEVKYAWISKMISAYYNEELADTIIHDLIRNDEHYIFERYYTDKYDEV
jgi:hypothetical protein